MATLYIATGNAGKLKELRELAIEYFPFFTNVVGRAPRDAEEIGADFIANASIKSRALVAELGAEFGADSGEEHRAPFWVLSDDSGLAIDALGGAPGLISARYAGDHVDPKLHIEKVLRELAPLKLPLEQRTARYHCALSLIETQAGGDSIETVAEGTCEGLIAFGAEGDNGFGYDPIFYSPEFGRTLSRVSFEEKNRASHRRRAFVTLKARVEGLGRAT